ncbi:hypothetical protein Zm00014a_030575 [Zea mays]|uniref:Uncharacterized protein n=1 Tax=Zea mays TaxID=4577 RepID=A0A3L6F2A3_MAIZE|nr:hypothetical protein Zm00014a_030575 [Zea mays]
MYVFSCTLYSSISENCCNVRASN